MLKWQHRQPVEIHFGSGTFGLLKDILKQYERPVVIVAPHLIGSELITGITEEGSIPVFGNISPNPDVTEVNECSRLIRESNGDLIVAIGGGSVIDLAKAASITAEDVSIYLDGGQAVPKKTIPLVAIPTTAGTGSEVTNVAVLTDREKGIKIPVVSDAFYPMIALVDPELTVTMPSYVTACSGIDVLSHAVEGYWSRNHNPVCDELALHAIKIVLEYLPKAYLNPDNLLYREQMAEASLFAGMAFNIPKTTSSHACSFPLTNVYHIPHGEACGLTLDYFIRINGSADRVKKLAERLGFDNPDELADSVLSLKKTVGLRTDLKDLKLTKEDKDYLVQNSHHPNLLNNPIEITDDILYDLYSSLT